MESFKEVSKSYQLITTGKVNFSLPTDIPTVSPTSKKKEFDNDILFSELSDLVNPQFKAWYCRRFYLLGREKVLQFASQARVDGKNPPKLFSHLIKGA
jgi:hypothetical protein